MRNAINDTMMSGSDRLGGRGRPGRGGAGHPTSRGSGDDFCAGADIIARNAGGERRPWVGAIQRRLPSQAHRLIPLLLRRPGSGGVPPSRGGRRASVCRSPLAADFTVAADDARMLGAVLPPVASPPTAGPPGCSPRLIGAARARELLLLGRELKRNRGGGHGASSTGPSLRAT